MTPSYRNVRARRRRSGDLTPAGIRRDDEPKPGLQCPVGGEAPVCRRPRVDLQILREAVLVAREAPRARQAVAPNLFRVPSAVHALIPDRREELRLERQREYVERPAFDRQILDGRD